MNRGEWITNPLPAEEMSTEDRLDEIAVLLAEAILRARVRRRRKLSKLSETRENRLELLRELRTHGHEPSRNGERP